MKHISVTGSSSMHVKPTVMEVDIEISGKASEFVQTVAMSTQETNRLKKAIEDIGFKKEDLKTKSFKVEADIQRYEERYGKSRTRLVGFKYKHNMKVTFAFDNQRLSKLLGALVDTGISFEFSLFYRVTKEEKKR